MKLILILSLIFLSGCSEKLPCTPDAYYQTTNGPWIKGCEVNKHDGFIEVFLFSEHYHFSKGLYKKGQLAERQEF